MVDVYHEFSFPYEMTVAMVKSLKPGGRLVFVEYRLEDPTVPILLVHKMSEQQVIKEMKLILSGGLGQLPRFPANTLLFSKRRRIRKKSPHDLNPLDEIVIFFCSPQRGDRFILACGTDEWRMLIDRYSSSSWFVLGSEIDRE